MGFRRLYDVHQIFGPAISDNTIIQLFTLYERDILYLKAFHSSKCTKLKLKKNT